MTELQVDPAALLQLAVNLELIHDALTAAKDEFNSFEDMLRTPSARRV